MKFFKVAEKVVSKAISKMIKKVASQELIDALTRRSAENRKRLKLKHYEMAVT